MALLLNPLFLILRCSIILHTTVHITVMYFIIINVILLYIIASLVLNVICRSSSQTKLESAINVIIKGPGGKRLHLDIKGSDQTLCSELFSRIKDVWGIPQEHQMLSFGGTLLQPCQRLKHYGIQDGSCIQLSIKGYGGGKDTDDGTSKESSIT